jgi:polyether ionophore transport system permease protein
MLTKDDFAGTLTLCKLIIRRDKISIPLFILFMVLFVVGVAASFQNLYPDETLRMTLYLQIQNNPSIVVLLGELLDPSIGALTAWRMGVPISLFIGLISIFLMIRHTRSEERKGRLELIDSTAVGRQASLSAAFITTFGVNLLIAVLIGLGLISLGLNSTSSLVLGLSVAAFGCLFAAITGVAVQLTESSGDARYLTVALLALFFFLRLIGWDDGDYSWVSWLSPYGWVHYVEPFAGDELWVLGIFLAFTAGLTALAYKLSSLRDLGAGIITQRPGPARASKSLRSTLALAWRLHRGMLFFWIIIFVLMGVMLGFTAQTITDIITTNPQFAALIYQLGGNAGLEDSFFAMFLAFLADIFALYAILATLKLNSQETEKYSELVLTSSVSRTQWAVSNLVFSVLGPAVVMIIFALISGLTYGLITGDLSDIIPRILGAALVYLPALWVFTGISMLLFGLVPRLAALSWVALVLVVIIDLLGEFFDLNQWILDISPFTHVPQLLAGDTIETPLILLLVVAALLILMGLLAYQRRDIMS